MAVAARGGDRPACSLEGKQLGQPLQQEPERDVEPGVEAPGKMIGEEPEPSRQTTSLLPNLTASAIMSGSDSHQFQVHEPKIRPLTPACQSQFVAFVSGSK